MLVGSVVGSAENSGRELVKIENTVEVMDFITGALKDLAEAKEDGNISFIEMIQLAIRNASPAIKAMVGADEIMPELKDLDAAEIKVLAEKGVALANAVMAFFAKAS